MSHIDYKNAILFGLPDCTINKIHRIQNLCAKLVMSAVKYESSIDILQKLHWLPVKSRVVFKLLMMAFRCINNIAPSYLDNLLIRRVNCQQLRSSSDPNHLIVPGTKCKTFAERAYSVTGPRL